MSNTFENTDHQIQVVAEIGCNHQGKVDLALRMVEEAAAAGANAVKFQKRDNKTLFGNCIFNQIYDNPSSYGATYGEHRERLELNSSDFKKIKKCASAFNIGLQVTPFDIKSLEFCEEIGFDSYKIASADIHFHQLVRKVCSTGKDIYMSTGGSTEDEIIEAKKIVDNYGSNLTLYHCTAAYPASVNEMNLGYITRMCKLFGTTCTIGLSDHENGIDAATIAFMLGARAFEKHFTLDRSLKGTDQSFSLEPTGLRKMIRNLNRVNIMMGSGKKEIFESEHKPLAKMIKSLIYWKDFSAGEKIEDNCFDYRVTLQKALRPSDEKKLIGKILRTDVKKGSLVSSGDFQP